eukprot:354265-Chlamydomonas_euryale.AAC.7
MSRWFCHTRAFEVPKENTVDPRALRDVEQGEASEGQGGEERKEGLDYKTPCMAEHSCTT